MSHENVAGSEGFTLSLEDGSPGAYLGTVEERSTSNALLGVATTWTIFGVITWLALIVPVTVLLWKAAF